MAGFDTITMSPYFKNGINQKIKLSPIFAGLVVRQREIDIISFCDDRCIIDSDLVIILLSLSSIVTHLLFFYRNPKALPNSPIHQN